MQSLKSGTRIAKSLQSKILILIIFRHHLVGSHGNESFDNFDTAFHS